MPDEQRIHEVARRPGGWTLRVGGECRPVFVAETDAPVPPAAGDVLRSFDDGRHEVIRPVPGGSAPDGPSVAG